ncbi:MAG TPA: hypothetical protein IAA58_09285 [Candidatus Gallacutalibacter stercoravium]|nr:hypothetical protein [Candidatus Gallacutalibacter stercoravium]
MEKMYYLFPKIDEKKKDKNECLESIYICGGSDYIDKPKSKTGVYSLGTMLSAVCDKLISLPKELDFCAILEKTLLTFRDSTFSVDNDIVFKDSLLSLLSLNRFHSERNAEQQIKLFHSYINYIKVCVEKPKFATLENLNLLCMKNKDTLPKRALYGGPTSKENQLFDDEPQNIINNFDVEIKDFDPPCTEARHKSLDLFDKDKIIVTGKYLKTPIYVYEIYDIVDFILAPLQVIFEQKYKIQLCQHCQKIFIDKRKRKYCLQQNFNGKNCNQHEKLQCQLERVKESESRRMHNSIRTMRSNKYGVTSPEYQKFLSDSKEWRDRIKSGQETEGSYIEWLKSFFQRKYK